jgi:hypothetical protein
LALNAILNIAAASAIAAPAVHIIFLRDRLGDEGAFWLVCLVVAVALLIGGAWWHWLTHVDASSAAGRVSEAVDAILNQHLRWIQWIRPQLSPHLSNRTVSLSRVLTERFLSSVHVGLCLFAGTMLYASTSLLLHGRSGMFLDALRLVPVQGAIAATCAYILLSSTAFLCLASVSRLRKGTNP